MNLVENLNKYKLNKVLKSISIYFILIMLFFTNVNSVLADELSDINRQLNEANAKLNETKSHKQTLQQQIAAFDGQIYAIQLQINVTQLELNQVTSQIAETTARIIKAESDLLKQKELMGEYLKTMYIEGQTSTIELVVKSNTFSDFVNRSEYLGTMQQKVQDTAEKIIRLKETLEKEKAELEVKKAKINQLKDSQVQQRNSLNQQKVVKDNLLAETRGLEANYKRLIENLHQKRLEISRKNNEIISGGSSSYPFANANPDGIDPWYFFNRQCTSYVAWKSSVTGPVPGDMLKHWGSSHVANGGDWAWLASSHGFNTSSSPTPGSIMTFPYGPGLPYGHVAFVESVNQDGTVNISEYNWSTPLGFGQRNNVNPANYGAIFITR